MTDATAPVDKADARTLACDILKQRFGEHAQTGEAIREQHGHTTSWLENQPPDIVVWPSSTEDVAEIVQIAATHKVPVIPFGVGTSLEGQLNAPEGGISIDFKRMNKVLEVHAEDLDAVVQPGITRTELNEYLRDTGFFFPIDPGADASIGGMAATRASGTNAVRYGTMKDVILSLEAVLPDGRIIRTGGRAKKSSAGYDLTRLMIGAEGTLGIITELTIRLSGIPEAMSSATCSFPSVAAACEAVIQTIQMGIPVSRIELMDESFVAAVNAYSKLTLPEKPLLLLEFHGSEASVAEQATTFGEIAADVGGEDFAWTTSPEERTRLWQARHDAYWAARAVRKGTEAITTDICVPISKLAESVAATQQKADELGLVAPIIGHVGDGNFHTVLLFDPASETERDNARSFVSWLNHLAVSMQGTCTGEHGIGQGKKPYLEAELGGAVDVMRAIKSAIDPDNIMNPGKIV